MNCFLSDETVYSQWISGRPGGSISAGIPHQLPIPLATTAFTNPSFDLSSDGKRILALV
jgi:hypothetical protein